MNENLFIKVLLWFTLIYFVAHVSFAMADIVTIHNPSEGTVKSCIINGGYITCI